eukprot:3290426-Prymnesium_polylepis.3
MLPNSVPGSMRPGVFRTLSSMAQPCACRGGRRGVREPRRRQSRPSWRLRPRGGPSDEVIGRILVMGEYLLPGGTSPSLAE